MSRRQCQTPGLGGFPKDILRFLVWEPQTGLLCPELGAEGGAEGAEGSSCAGPSLSGKPPIFAAAPRPDPICG